MRYIITIDREEESETESGTLTTLVYSQSFDELNEAETITRLNHVPVKRPRKPKAPK